MFKLVVLSALLALTVAKPSGVWLGNPVVETYSAPVVAAVPSAVSHTYRKDVISEPAVVAYSTPVVQKYIATAPVVAAPVVQKYVAAPVAVPAAVSHSYRSDIVSKPVVAAYAAPWSYGYGW
ncbi:pupal cuticle protein G1A-like [Diorhabda sublineata]|uniref:pupal cuticle protein G1A-like n=1 Tax=Diorhabda sublineata TaxID=1163346 RepID=UPI0024E08D46|nr:pupal cuticle protein G1A-like [Diorhabda sublineata]